MKKPIQKTRPRRFAEGGMTDEDALKSKGLEESNKEAPVGFFERLRMGNIDDPSSEAYKRFGAGRGKSMAVPVEDRTPVPVNQIKDEDSFERVIKNAAINDQGEVIKPATSTPTPQAKKPMASVPDKADDRSKYKYSSLTNKELDDYAANRKKANYEAAIKAAAKPEAKEAMRKQAEGDAVENVYPEQMLGGVGIKSIARAAKALAERTGGKRVLNTISQDAIEAAKPLSIGGPRAINGPNAIKGSGDGFVMYKKGGQVKKMAAGGSVSSRADGIAQRGKTRGKMC